MKNKLPVLFFKFILFCHPGMAEKIISGAATPADKVNSYNLQGSYSIDMNIYPFASLLLPGKNPGL
jgi:hypothetical protein